MKTRAEIVSILSRAHRQYLKELDRAKELLVDPIMTADDAWERKLLAERHDVNPIQSGIAFWDDLVGPFRRGNLYVLAGYAGVGKTTLATQLSWATARQDRKVWFYCLELTPEEVLEVLVGHLVEDAEPHGDRYAPACAEIQKSGFRFLDSTTYRKWNEHLEIIPRAVRQHGIEMLVIDNFHYLTRTDKNTLEVEGVVSQR